MLRRRRDAAPPPPPPLPALEAAPEPQPWPAGPAVAAVALDEPAHDWATAAEPIDVTDHTIELPALAPMPRRRAARAGRAALTLALVLGCAGAAVAATGVLQSTSQDGAPATIGEASVVAAAKPHRTGLAHHHRAARHHRAGHPRRRVRRHLAVASPHVVAAAPAPAAAHAAPVRAPAPVPASRPAPKPAPGPVVTKPTTTAAPQPAASPPSGEPGRQPPPSP